MAMLGRYERTTALSNKDAGSCRWCFAIRGGQEYFIKEFLEPKYPENDTTSSPEKRAKKIKKCEAFEQNKTKIYRTVNEQSDGNAVRVVDFFRVGAKYYMVMPKINPVKMSVEEIARLPEHVKRRICTVIVHSVAQLHKSKFVHADIKHTNIMLVHSRTSKLTAKLIDYDAGFFEGDPPTHPEEIHFDQVYVSPEAWTAILGEEATLTCKLDIFALGVLFHQYLTGKLPGYDEEKFSCAGEAVAAGEKLNISWNMPADLRRVVYQMLAANPYERPSAQDVFNSLTKSDKLSYKVCHEVEGITRDSFIFEQGTGNCDRGYISPYMVTDTDKMEAVIDDAFILITDKKISNIQEILPLLEQILQSGKKLVIVAEDLEGEALSTILVNKLRGTFTCVAVKAPGFGDRRKEMLRDIATLTGGEVITEELGLELKDTQLTQLGRARQVKISKENTIIVDGAGDKAEIAARVAQIRTQIGTTTSDFDREKLQERLAKLAGGVAVIRVGAATETEMKEKKLRIEDALAATKAAVEEGCVAGGGVALINAIPAVEALLDTDDADIKTGVKIVLKALEAPVRQIAANAGLEGSVIVNEIRTSGKTGFGYNFASDGYVDMFEAGILDPTKVTRSALENASSVAAMVLTTESLVTDKPDPQADAAQAAAMAAAQGGGMY